MIPNGSMPLRAPEDIGALVKRVRTELNLTQLQLADQAGVGRRFVVELESGKPTAQLGKALRVLSMLGIAIVGVRP